MTTPFTPSGSVDEAAAERLADRLATHGLGVFVLGTTGETASIPGGERSRLVTAALQATSGRVPVYAGIGDNCMSDMVAAGRSYLAAGVTAVVAHPPSYYPLTSEELHDCFQLLHRQLAGPMMLYNIPQTTGMSLPLDVVERLADLPHIVGFKDSENDPARMKDTAGRFGGRPDFAILMGVAALSVPALRLGFVGLVPSSANLVPALWRELWDHAVAGRWDQASRLQERLDTIGGVLQRNRNLGGYLAALKAGLAAKDLCGPSLLPPLRGLEEAERQSVVAELVELQVL